MRKREFQRLLNRLGSRKIAKRLGVAESTVRRWAREGVPSARKAAVAKLEKPAKKARPKKPAKKARPKKPAKKARPKKPAKKARPKKPAKKARPKKPAKKPAKKTRRAGKRTARPGPRQPAKRRPAPKAFHKLYADVGAKNLAALFEVSQSTIYRWRKAGIPPKRQAEFREVLKSVKASARELRDELKARLKAQGQALKMIRQLVERAIREGHMARPGRFQRHRRGQRTAGYEAQHPVGKLLSRETIEEVAAFIRSFKPRAMLPYWLGTVTLSELREREPFEPKRRGEGRTKRPYPTVLVLFKGADDLGLDFTAQSVVATGQRASRKDVIATLVDDLSALLGDPTIYFVQSVYVLNYRFFKEADATRKGSET